MEVKMSDLESGERIKEAVRETYGGIARRFTGAAAPAARQSCCGGAPEPDTRAKASAGCCGDRPEQAAEARMSGGDGAEVDAGGCGDAAARF
jgi:hypothetical protein